VEDGNLAQNIYLLRKTLNEGSNGKQYVETVARRGYRFVGEVREIRNGGRQVGHDHARTEDHFEFNNLNRPAARLQTYALLTAVALLIVGLITTFLIISSRHRRREPVT